MIYMPMIPEAAAAMLACARIGAVHSVVFGGFSPESLAGRIADCGARVVITADEGVRGGKRIPLKANVDAACASPAARSSGDRRHPHRRRRADGRAAATCDWADGATACRPTARPRRWTPRTRCSSSTPRDRPESPRAWSTPPAAMRCGRRRPSTGFSSARDDDIFWCTADVGWITGHSYVVYGPLMNGATSVMFDGVPNYPDFGRFWETVDRLGVTIFYTAPTAIRALSARATRRSRAIARSSLRLLGTVGEPINPEAWEWYWRVVGDGRCPIVDTWWQTETGGILIANFPGAMADEAGQRDPPAARGRAAAGRCRGPRT